MHLHLVQSIDTKTGGGLATSCLELADAQFKNGFSVSVVSSTERDTPLLPNSFKEFTYVGKRKFHNPILYSCDMENLLLKVKCNGSIIHNHGFYMYSSFLATKLKKNNDFVLMQHVHGMFEPWILNRSRFKKGIANLLFENYKYKKAEYWRALTVKEADQIHNFGVKGEVVVLPNGIDLVPIDNYLSKNINEINEKKIILFLGRIHLKKGIVPFLKTWCSLSSDLKSKWEFQIIGPDDGCLNILKNIAKEDDSVIFLDSVYGDEKFNRLQNADLFVLPSFSEGFSMAVLEAMGFSKPILITDECNFEEAFNFGAIKLSSDLHDWKDELGYVLNIDSSEFIDRGKELRSLVNEKYTWNKIANELNNMVLLK